MWRFNCWKQFLLWGNWCSKWGMFGTNLQTEWSMSSKRLLRLSDRYLFFWLLFTHFHHFQIRLDFNTFTITGPSTLTTTGATVLHVNGAFDGATGKKAIQRTRCNTDTFSVSNAPSVPLVCGTLTGDHGELLPGHLRRGMAQFSFSILLLHRMAPFHKKWHHSYFLQFAIARKFTCLAKIVIQNAPETS